MDIVIYKAKKARFTSLKILAQLPLHLLCQTLERALVDILTTMVANVLQPRQFAYKSDRDTDDTVLVLSDLVSKQLTVTKGYARVLFDDYSAAFNSLKLHTLLTQLANLNTEFHSLDQRFPLLPPSEDINQWHSVRNAHYKNRLPTR